MLRRPLTILAVLVPLAFIGPVASAEPECVERDVRTGTCILWSEDDIDLESPTDEDGSFGDAACFDVGRADPQPAFTHPAWGGRTDGEIRLCTTQIDGRGPRDYYWAPGPPDGTDAPVP
jgi:hypothetical protein